MGVEVMDRVRAFRARLCRVLCLFCEAVSKEAHNV